MPVDLDTVDLAGMPVSRALRADGWRTPRLFAWLNRHGGLSSAVLGQLAETGIRSGSGLVDANPLSPHPTEGPPTTKLGEAAHTIRLRLVLHPLSHPFLIGHLASIPAELHRRTLLNAIEFGIQIVLGVRSPEAPDSLASQSDRLADVAPAVLVSPSITHEPSATTESPEPVPPMMAMAPNPAPALLQSPPPSPVALLDLGSLSTLITESYE